MSIERVLRRLSAGTAVVGLGILLLLGPLARSASAATTSPVADSGFSSLLNGLRASQGLAPLAVDGSLSDVARAWSARMASTGVLAHNGGLAGQVVGWSKVGENVGTGGAVTQVFNALVGSPAHLRNMVDPGFTMLGVGTVMDGQGRLWTTHVFVRPEGAVAAPAAQPVVAAAAPRAPAPAPVRAPQAPRPAPTTAAPPPPPPTTAAPVPVTVPVPTTAAAPGEVESAGGSPAIEVSAPPPPSVLAPAGPAPERQVPLAVVAGAALLGLLVLGGGGVALRRSASSARNVSDEGPSEDLSEVLDLGRR